MTTVNQIKSSINLVDHAAPKDSLSPEAAKIQAAIQMKYNVGAPTNAVGQPKPVQISELAKLKAMRHFVKGDGSCWARALWQTVFSQVYRDPAVFDRFISKVASPQAGYDIPDHLANEVIHILHHMKEMTPAERIDYLNHQNVDHSLIFFMRHVAAEEMRHKDELLSAADVRDIKTNIARYGGPEIGAFNNYFNLEYHNIAKNGQKIWHYYTKNPGKASSSKPIRELINEPFPIPHFCMFGATSYHFEFISFEYLADLTNNAPVVGAEVEQCLDQLARQIQEDRKLAEELQKKYDAEFEASKKQQEADRELAIKVKLGLTDGKRKVVQNLIKRGSQAACNGDAPKEAAGNIVDRLQQRTVAGIKFNKSKLDGTVSGGTCSAMSLNFMHEFFKWFETKGNPALSVKNVHDAITEMNDVAIERANQDFRTLQAAYNTIEKDSAVNLSEEDFMHAKVESLAHHFDLTLGKGSIVKVRERGAKTQLKNVFNSLVDGTYVVRQILPKDNEKGEEHGHTCILIKTGETFFFYDPNPGVKSVTHDDGAQLFEILKGIDTQWQDPLVQIYPVKRNLIADQAEHAVPAPNPQPQPMAPPENPPKPVPVTAGNNRPTVAPKPPQKPKGGKAKPTFFSRVASFLTRVGKFFAGLGKSIAAFFKKLLT